MDGVNTNISEDSLQLFSTPNNCKICLVSEAKYTCPRCNLSYCSVQCYQSEKHVGCSEAFYKDWVMNELKNTTNNSAEKKKVMAMLTHDLEERVNEELDEDSEDDLAERIDGLDLDKDISTVWKRLTNKEKEEFAKMFQDGRLAKLVEIWIPWWRSEKNNKLVIDENEVIKKNEDKIPEILTDFPDINVLLKDKRPSANLRFDMINILFSYAYVSRVHNGTHLECPVDSCQEFLSVCVVLQDQISCSSLGESIQKSFDCLYSKEKVSKTSTVQFYISLLEDVKKFITGPANNASLSFMMAALSDLIHLVRLTLGILKKEGKHSEELKSLKSKVFKAEKKLLFMMSWLQRYGMGLHNLLPLIQFEIETRQAEYEIMNELKSDVETNMEAIKTLSGFQDSFNEKKKIVELT